MMNDKTIDYTCLNKLSVEEVKSLLKSNVISWNRRRLIRISLANKIINRLLPFVSYALATNCIIELMRSVDLIEDNECENVKEQIYKECN